MFLVLSCGLLSHLLQINILGLLLLLLLLLLSKIKKKVKWEFKWHLHRVEVPLKSTEYLSTEIWIELEFGNVGF